MRSLWFLNTTPLYWDYTSLEGKKTWPCPSQLCEPRKATWVQGQDEIWEGTRVLSVQPSPSLSTPKCWNSYLLSARIRIMEAFFLSMQFLAQFLHIKNRCKVLSSYWIFLYFSIPIWKIKIMIVSVIGLFEGYKDFFFHFFKLLFSYKATYELLSFNNVFKFFIITYFT